MSHVELTGRRRCHYCGRAVALRNDGAFRAHRRVVASRRYVFLSYEDTQRCPGSGKRPTVGAA